MGRANGGLGHARTRRRGGSTLAARARLAASAVALGSALLGGAAARAEEPQPPPERIKAAAEEFDRGRRAFLAKDYGEAAVHFESAYRDAPRAETLRLAIRARKEAKQLARAATLAAVAQQRYGGDAATSQLARQTLDEAAPLLHEYDVTCSADCSVTADGRVVSQGDALRLRIFLEPGPHDLGIGFAQGSVARHVESKKGGKEPLSFEPPPPPPVTPPPTGGPGAGAGGPGGDRPKPVEAPSTKPLSPIVFFVGAGLAVALGGATVVSGLDAQENPGVDAVRRDCAGKDESCPTYQEGRDAQLRTNILLAATGGVALVSGVLGVFFTDWSGGRPAKAGAPRPSVGLAPGGVVVTGRF